MCVGGRSEKDGKCTVKGGVVDHQKGHGAGLKGPWEFSKQMTGGAEVEDGGAVNERSNIPEHCLLDLVHSRAESRKVCAIISEE